MTELEKCEKFLIKNGYIAMHSSNSDEECQTMYTENEELMHIDLNEDEIVFIDGNGDFLHLPCSYYALIGALIHFAQISIGYHRL